MQYLIKCTNSSDRTEAFVLWNPLAVPLPCTGWTLLASLWCIFESQSLWVFDDMAQIEDVEVVHKHAALTFTIKSFSHHCLL